MGVADVLEAEGIELRLNATCLSVAKHADGVAVNVDCTEGAPQVVGSHLLLAVGRRPNTDDLGLDKAGVATDARGYITVDDSCAPMCRASSRSATATGAARSRIPPTTTSRSWRRTCSTARTRRVTDRIPGLRALHRSAARPLRHDRGRSAQVRPSGADRHHADGGREPRLREGRDQRLHEDPGRQGDEAVPRRLVLRAQRRRDRPHRARPDVRQGALHRDRARDAHPSDGDANCCRRCCRS